MIVDGQFPLLGPMDILIWASVMAVEILPWLIVITYLKLLDELIGSIWQ